MFIEPTQELLWSRGNGDEDFMRDGKLAQLGEVLGNPGRDMCTIRGALTQVMHDRQCKGTLPEFPQDGIGSVEEIAIERKRFVQKLVEE